jgi:topoisomerase-4 subunit B
MSGLRYGKVVVMSDADVDGSHIQTLLLTLFFKHFPRLVEQGRIHIAQPPLYRVDVPARGKKPMRRFYALDDDELQAIQDRLVREGIKPEAIEVGRFKGLGEMNPEQLRETAMSPATRRVVPIRVTRDEMETAVAMFDMLMGKGEAGARREWMELKGNTVEADI